MRSEQTLVAVRTVAAPPGELYRVVADPAWWPAVFPECVHAEREAAAPGSDRLRVWSHTGERVRVRTVARTLDPGGLRIGFTEPGTGRGVWTFKALRGGHSEIVLTQRIVAGNEVPDAEADLAALDRVAGQPHAVDAVLLDFADVMPLETTAQDAYRFVAESDRWPDLLPHVARVDLVQEHAVAGEPVVQDMTMDTLTADGGRHTTRSIRLCFPATTTSSGRIVYKQLLPPTQLVGHSGAWDFADGPAADRTGPARAVATHRLALDAAVATELLGDGATLADARAHLRAVLGANSRATLAAAAGSGAVA